MKLHKTFIFVVYAIDAVDLLYNVIIDDMEALLQISEYDWGFERKQK